MPSYNSGDFIGPAIESVLKQTFDRLELIIVDNDSVDNTQSIIRSYDDPRIRFFTDDFNRVIAKSRNHGAMKAEGRMLAFLDSDDLWEPTKLETQIGYLEDPRVSCIASDFVPAGNVARFVNHLSFSHRQLFRDYYRHEIIMGNPVVASSAVVRSKDFFECGMFDENPAFFAIEDWELWMRLSKRGVIRILSEPLVRYRVGFSKKRDTRIVTLNSLEVVRKHTENDVPRQVAVAALGNCYTSIGRAFLEFEDRGGVAYYLKGLRYGRGYRIKLRCVWGLFLFTLPSRLRKRLLTAAYKAHYYCSRRR
jgi:glycosyltransferase involved in cell wall biosynthesis